MYLSSNSKYSSFNCQLAKAEKADCVVRSIASATGVSYRTAHQFCREVFKREDRQGTKNVMLTSGLLKMEEKGMKIDNKEFSVRKLGKVETKNMYKLKGDVIWRKKTLKSFVQSHPKGTFLVMVAKHALTIKDGELMDWDNNKFEPTRKVMEAYELKNKNQAVQLSLF
jgi:hypothetical protein